jgi:transposase
LGQITSAIRRARPALASEVRREDKRLARGRRARRYGFPAEVEAVLNAHPAVVQSALVGRAVDANEEVVAFVQLLPGSNATVTEVEAYPRETQEMVFDAHDRAFALFKGTCGRGIYDNMKTAVETIFVGKERLYNRRFLQMCSHYLVDPVACTPASGWEKGQVKNQVGLVRERFFTPRLRFKTLDELNAWLLDKQYATRCRVSGATKSKRPQERRAGRRCRRPGAGSDR